jgi:hypothetical protein
METFWGVRDWASMVMTDLGFLERFDKKLYLPPFAKPPCHFAV